jgi:hypothetical protein
MPASNRKSRKSPKSAPEGVILQNIESVEGVESSETVIEHGDAGLDGLLAEIEAFGSTDEVAAEETDPADELDEGDAGEVAADDADSLDELVAAATGEVGPEAVEINVPAAEIAGADVAPVEAAPVEVVAETAKKGKGKKAHAEPKAKVERKFYSNKADRLVDRIGTERLGEFTVLTAADAGITDEDVKAAMEATMAIIKGMSGKKQNRASFLIEFVANKRAKLNPVLDRVLRVLARDGHITTSNEGNMLQDLVKGAGYTGAAARAMGGNTVAMFADLKLLVADGKGKFVGNPESLLLTKVNAMLGLTPGAVAA